MKVNEFEKIGVTELSNKEKKSVQGGLIGWFIAGFLIGTFIGIVTGQKNEEESIQL